MKKQIAKLMSLILVAGLVLSMTACGSKETPAEPAAQETAKEEPVAQETAKEESAAKADAAAEEPAKENSDSAANLIGTYKGQLDFTEQASQEFSESLGFEVEDPLYMDVYMELREDNTFSLYVDAEKYKADVIAILSSHIDDILAKSLEQNGMTMDQLGALAQANGYDDEESFKEAMVEVLEAELEENIDLTEYEDDLNISGEYTVSGSTILLTNEDGMDTVFINDDGSLSMVVPLDGVDNTVTMTKVE